MASIRERTLSNGERTFQVLYRHGKRQPSMSFTDRESAETVAAMITKFGPDRALKMLASEAAPDSLTVDQLADKFLEWKAPDVTERTLKDYRRDVDNWIRPWLGHRAADSVDEVDVQEWVEHMRGKLEPKSIAGRHMLLNSMYQFGRARSRRLVEHNPCLETQLPARTKKPPKGMTVPAFTAVLSHAKKRNSDAHDLILFLGETGWRFSEATALAVAYVEDLGPGQLWVTVGGVTRLDASGRQYLATDEAKTYAAFRRIRMLPETEAMIRRRLVGRGPGDLLFTNGRGRQWNQNTFLRETWPKILTDAGLWKGPRKSPTPHWLRHMHVAVCAAAGVPMHEIQRRIGHDHYSTTVDVYGGLIGDMSDDAMSKAAALMAGRSNAPGIAPAASPGVVAGVVVADDIAADSDSARRAREADGIEQ